MIRGLLTGAACGAAWLYLFDPNLGKSRRARIRDRALRAVHDGEDFVQMAGRDLNNRLAGCFQEMAHCCESGPVGDDKVEARVRTKLGRAVRHPKSVEVRVRDGQVTLRGRVATDEVQCLVHCVENVPGVESVQNELETAPPHDADLQQHADHAGWLPRTWPPALRLVAYLAGGALLTKGLIRVMPVSFTIAAGLGGAMLAASAGSDSGQRRGNSGQRNRSDGGETRLGQRHEGAVGRPISRNVEETGIPRQAGAVEGGL